VNWHRLACEEFCLSTCRSALPLPLFGALRGERAGVRGRAAGADSQMLRFFAPTRENQRELPRRSDSRPAPPHPTLLPRRGGRRSPLRQVEKLGFLHSCVGWVERILQASIPPAQHSFKARGRFRNILRRHARREEGRKRHAVAGARRRGEASDRRRIAPRRLYDRLRRDELSGDFEKAAFAGAEIGGAARLFAPGGDFARRLVRFFGKRVAVGEAVGSRDSARPVVFIKRLDPDRLRPCADRRCARPAA
jgi:hypothetical protein